MQTLVRVGVVDDHPSILAALSAAIDAADDLDLTGTGRTLADAVDLARRVDVLVCDVQLDGHAEGLTLLEVARELSVRPAVLLLSGHGHPSVVRAAVERGAAGYIDKSAEMDVIVDAIRTVAIGGTAVGVLCGPSRLRGLTGHRTNDAGQNPGRVRARPRAHRDRGYRGAARLGRSDASGVLVNVSRPVLSAPHPGDMNVAHQIRTNRTRPPAQIAARVNGRAGSSSFDEGGS